MTGILHALAGPGSSSPMRIARAAGKLPRAVGSHRRHVQAMCEVAEMLSDRLSVPAPVTALFAHFTARWDGKGESAGLRGTGIPLALRIVHVARDVVFQRLLGGDDYAVRVAQERAGHAFDPAVVAELAVHAVEILDLDERSAWDDALALEPAPWLFLSEHEVDRALAAMGDFADLVSPFLVGHSSGVAALVTEAGRSCRLPRSELTTTRRAALVHDLGRVALWAGVWQKATSLTPDEWERVRLHAYHSERILSRSPFLAALAPIASAHHERLDGGGYHRGSAANTLSVPARLLAAADAYHAMTEPRAPPGSAGEPCRGRAAQRVTCGAARRRLCRRRAGGRRASRPARRATGRSDRARGPGRCADRTWNADQAGRTCAWYLGQDGRPTRTERLFQDRRLDPGCGRALRHGARPRGMGRTPDGRPRQPLLAS